MVRRLLRAIWAYISPVMTDPVRATIVIVAFLLGGVSGFPTGQAGYQYTWSDARFCDDCHIHDYANQAWARSIHAHLTTCHDCHRVPIRHYPRNLWKTVLEGAKTQDEMHIPEVENVVCEQCHAESGMHEPLSGPMPEAVRQALPKVDNSPLHRVHQEAETRLPGRYRGAKGKGKGKGKGKDDHGAHDGGHGKGHGETSGPIQCMDCHGKESNRAHGFQSNTENCVACHEDQHPQGGRLETLQCRECHFSQFLASEPK